MAIAMAALLVACGDDGKGGGGGTGGAGATGGSGDGTGGSGGGDGTGGSGGGDGTGGSGGGDGTGGSGGGDGTGGSGGAEAPEPSLGLQLPSSLVVPLTGSADLEVTIQHTEEMSGDVEIDVKGALPPGLRLSPQTVSLEPSGATSTTIVLKVENDGEADDLELARAYGVIFEATWEELKADATVAITLAPVVTSLENDGPGSLRAVLAAAARATGGKPTITFAPELTSDGGAVIQLTEPLTTTHLDFELEGPVEEGRRLISLDAEG